MTLRHRLMLVYLLVVLLSAATVGAALFELQHAHAIMGDLRQWHEVVLNVQDLKGRWRPSSGDLPHSDLDLKGELARQFMLLGRIATGMETGEIRTGTGEYHVTEAVRAVLHDVYRKYDQWSSLPEAVKPKQTEIVEEALQRLWFTLQSELDKINFAADSQSIRMRVLLTFVVAITLIHIAAVGMLLKRWLLRPMEQLGRQVEALAHDEAPNEPLLQSPQEMASLASALDRARQSLGALRQQLLDSERLTTIGQMAAQLAHNLRNPLASIRAAAQLTGRQNAATESMQRRMADIVGSVDRLNRWVMGLMEVARRDPTSTQDADVVTALRQALEAVQEEVAAKELILQLDAPAEGLVCAHDPATLEHALIAMLVNAVETSPLGGKLGVQVAYVVKNPSAVCRITVTDEGAGLPTDDPERIFEFSYTTKQSGLGLGLALARQALHRQGGSTHARNNPGGGASVYIELPVRPEAE